MRIVIVSHYYPPHPGGLEVVVQKQAESLSKIGHKVLVMTPQIDNKKTNFKIENGAKIARYRSIDFLDKRFGIPFPIVSFRFIKDLFRELKNADLVHIHDVFYLTSWLTYFVNLFYRKPLILTQHVAMVKHQSSLVEWLQKIVYKTIGKLIFKKSRSIVVYNRIVRDFLLTNEVSENKIVELRNGIDLDFFVPVSKNKKKEIRKELGLLVDKPIVLFAGRMVAKKGFDKLFEARDSDYEIIFAGPGEVPKKWKEEKGVRFIGAYDLKTIRRFYQAADLFVFPAMGEIFTIVMQEAMACGLPIITSDDPGYRTYNFDKKLISLIDPTPANIKNEIKRVLGDSKIKDEMSNYSLKMANELFNWNKNFLEIDKLYKKKKLLIFAPYFYPKIGGVEEHTYQLHKGLANMGYQITIVTSLYDPKLPKKEILSDMEIIRLPFRFKVSNTPINISWLWQVKKIIKESSPDLIMSHAPVPFLPDISILSKGKIPAILKYHSGTMTKENGWLENLIISLYEKYILKLVIDKADYLMCTSDFVRNEFLKEFKYKSSTITPAVDTDKYYPEKNAKENKSILFVGRIDKTSEWKGINYLIDAFEIVQKEITDAKLVIVGGGDGLDEKIEYVKKNSLKNVIFAGQKRDIDLVKAFQDSSVFVLPSTTNAESFGMVLIEAMACGKPVVGSRVGGIPYVINDGIDGYLVPPKDSKSLAKAIIKILKSDKLANKMGEMGHKKVTSQYTWSQKIEETNKIIVQVLNHENHC